MLRTLVILSILALAACGGNNGLRDERKARGSGPDAFSALPQRELQLPATFAQLPPPTPGGDNRADLNPQADAIAALGGRAGAGVAGDPALIVHATRFGVDASIRENLRQADERFRTTRSRLSLFRRSNAYYAAYANHRLDAYAEMQRLGRAGVQVPAAPPR